MIRVIKDGVTVPRILTREGVVQTAADCTRFRLNSARYLAGIEKIAWLDYHRNDTVKRALLKLQYRKCCYCEQRRRRSELAVEHFRPRTAIRQAKKGPLIYPGYFWLAYSWSNLYLSCDECNSRFKSAYFPLLNPTARARQCTDLVKNERSILVDPGGDNPRRHFRFEGPEMVGLTGRGRKTIELLQLNEDNLMIEREEKIDILDSLLNIVELAGARPEPKWQQKAAEAIETLTLQTRSNAEFAMMNRDYLARKGFIPDRAVD